jgi:protein-tyrosine phosphatase
MSRKYLFLSVLFISIPAFAGDAPGIKNFDQVDQHVYRGGQPTNEGFQQLAKLGVKTVIDLREAGERATAEARTVSGAGMTYINIPMSGLTPPSEAEITKILNILEEVTSGPVFVHCMRGADRTGTVIAAYHINHDHWGNEQALKDAKKHGMSRFQFPRMSYIRSFRPRAINAKAANPGGAGSGAAEPAAASAPTPVAATVKN